MFRHAREAAVLAAIIAALSGCESHTATVAPAAHSERTDYAYPAAAQADGAQDKVKQYADMLGKVVKPGKDECPPVEAKPVPVQIAPVPLMPLEEAEPTSLHPLNPRAPIRVVDMPPAVRPATPIQPPGAPAGMPAAALAAQTPAAAEPVAPSPPPTPTSEPARKMVVAPAIPPPAHASLEDVIAYNEGQASDQPESMELQLRLRMMYLAARQDQKALAPIPGMPADQNQAVHMLLQSMIAIRDNTEPSVPASEASISLIALQNLRERLMSFADLQIPLVKLCKSVDGYGVYKTFDSNEFPAGRSQPVIVYCELRNYAADPDESGLFHTRLNVNLTLYDAQGQVAQTQADKNVEDISANRRNDFFLTRVIILPATLKSGTYTLKTTVEDLKANKVGTTATPIVIQPPAVASFVPPATTLPAAGTPAASLQKLLSRTPGSLELPSASPQAIALPGSAPPAATTQLSY